MRTDTLARPSADAVVTPLQMGEAGIAVCHERKASPTFL